MQNYFGTFYFGEYKPHLSKTTCYTSYVPLRSVNVEIKRACYVTN